MTSLESWTLILWLMVEAVQPGMADFRSNLRGQKGQIFNIQKGVYDPPNGAVTVQTGAPDSRMQCLRYCSVESWCKFIYIHHGLLGNNYMCKLSKGTKSWRGTQFAKYAPVESGIGSGKRTVVKKGNGIGSVDWTNRIVGEPAKNDLARNFCPKEHPYAMANGDKCCHLPINSRTDVKCGNGSGAPCDGGNCYSNMDSITMFIP